MNELIKIEEAVISNEKVNARELYSFLEVKSEFNHWIKDRIERHHLQEGQDFLTATVKEGKRGRPRTEYYIPLDMTKKLLDLETSKGRKSLPDNIYIIQNTFTKSIKIGVSKDVEGRLNSLQTGHEHQLELIYAKSVEEALKLESKLHRKFSSKRIRGEWFKVNPEKVIKEVEELTAKGLDHLRNKLTR